MDNALDDFPSIMKALHDFLQPVAVAHEKKDVFKLKWHPGGPWN
jgi:hypothetical protein